MKFTNEETKILNRLADEMHRSITELYEKSIIPRREAPFKTEEKLIIDTIYSLLATISDLIFNSFRT